MICRREINIYLSCALYLQSDAKLKYLPGHSLFYAVLWFVFTWDFSRLVWHRLLRLHTRSCLLFRLWLCLWLDRVGLIAILYASVTAYKCRLNLFLFWAAWYRKFWFQWILGNLSAVSISWRNFKNTRWLFRRSVENCLCHVVWRSELAEVWCRFIWQLSHRLVETGVIDQRPVIKFELL